MEILLILAAIIVLGVIDCRRHYTKHFKKGYSYNRRKG